MKKVMKQGSVRADLLGGTLDIHPLNLILKNVVTLNVALSHKAQVEIEESTTDDVEIYSLDYNRRFHFKKEDFNPQNLSNHYFQEMGFIAQLMVEVGLTSRVKLTLSSGAPAGSGLGGSSAMGIVAMKALLDYQSLIWSDEKILKTVMNVEARVLDCGPTGYQDYYPAVYGGILSLTPTLQGISCQQLYDPEVAFLLEKNLCLIYSGKQRFSAINNWEVFQAFFNGDQQVRLGLQRIADLSAEALGLLKNKNIQAFCHLVVEEGNWRKGLFTNIVPPEVLVFEKGLKTIDPALGIKMCGAGGGGCFLLYHGQKNMEKIQQLLSDHHMQNLGFQIVPPQAL